MPDLTQCAACGYIAETTDGTCPRCGHAVDEAFSPPPPPAEPPAYEPEFHFASPPQMYAPPRPVVIEPRQRNPVVLVGGLLVLATIACFAVFYVYLVKPENEKLAKADALKAMLTQQPDFLADCEGLEGDFSYTGKMARKGDRFLFLVDFPRSILLNDPSRTGETPITALITPSPNVEIVVPELRAYIEVPRNTKNMPKNDPIRDILAFIDDKKCDVRDFGASSVGEYPTRLFCVSAPDGSRRDAYVEVAPSLGNLIVKLDFNDDWTSYDGPLKYTLSHVQTSVDEDLFRIPSTYTKIGK